MEGGAKIIFEPHHIFLPYTFPARSVSEYYIEKMPGDLMAHIGLLGDIPQLACDEVCYEYIEAIPDTLDVFAIDVDKIKSPGDIVEIMLAGRFEQFQKALELKEEMLGPEGWAEYCDSAANGVNEQIRNFIPDMDSTLMYASLYSIMFGAFFTVITAPTANPGLSIYLIYTNKRVHG